MSIIYDVHVLDFLILGRTFLGKEGRKEEIENTNIILINYWTNLHKIMHEEGNCSGKKKKKISI